MEAGGKTQAPKAAEPKAQASGTPAAGEEDLSMEEILQSIRRIIAEDDKEGKKPVAADNTKANGSKAKKADEDVPGSDVLELTEMIKDDGTVESLKPAVADATPAKKTDTADVLTKIDEALTPAKPPEKPIEKPIEKPPEAPVAKTEQKPAEPVAVAAPSIAVPPAPVPVASLDSLLSSEAAKASADAFKRLKTAEDQVPAAVVTQAPAFRDGTTVEDLVTDMLRPMMKAWLDTNLPQIVERIVEREVKKLTK